MSGEHPYKPIEGIICPECHAELSKDDGLTKLSCKEHGDYPLKNGIPVFAEDHDFDDHWDDNLSQSIPEQKLIIGREFLRPAVAFLSTPGIKVLDAGCGDGVHAVLMNEVLADESTYYGLDISYSAVRQAVTRFKKDKASFINSDVARMPFPDNYFQATFSFGVLAYTTDPEESFKELVRVTAVDGLIGIWIYPKKKGLGGALFSGIRNICRFSGRKVTILIANLIVPFLALLPTQSGMNLANASWKQCREIVMVNIAPTQLFFPYPEEVKEWLDKMQVEIIDIDKKNLITIWGRKKV